MSLLRLLALSLLVTLLTAAWQVDRVGHTDDAGPADAIVVLGARVHANGRASATLRARTLHAVRLYKQGLAPMVLFSGGVGDFGEAEAIVARAIAIEAGVPAQRCLVEVESHSTAQNAALSAPQLRAHGVHRVLVVSDAFHLTRARLLFEREGFAVRTSGVVGGVNDFFPLRVFWTLREVAALARLAVTT